LKLEPKLYQQAPRPPQPPPKAQGLAQKAASSALNSIRPPDKGLWVYMALKQIIVDSSLEIFEAEVAGTADALQAILALEDTPSFSVKAEQHKCVINIRDIL
jgi:hypothetical protein